MQTDKQENEAERGGREERSSVHWRLERFIDGFCINNVRRERERKNNKPR